VERTDSGLASRVLSKGIGGKRPGRSSEVTVHYTGWKSSTGEMFDSSFLRNNPSKFKLSEVIAGWTEGVGLMEVGEKRRLWVPGKLGYGEEDGTNPMKGDIVFDVELIEVDDPGDNLIQGFLIAGVVLLGFSLAVSTFSEPPERAEYDTQRPFSFKVYGT